METGRERERGKAVSDSCVSNQEEKKKKKKRAISASGTEKFPAPGPKMQDTSSLCVCGDVQLGFVQAK